MKGRGVLERVALMGEMPLFLRGLVVLERAVLVMETP